MGGGKAGTVRTYTLKEVLTDRNVDDVLRKIFNDIECEVVGSVVRPATDGLSGYLGEHIRAALHVRVGGASGRVQEVHLFVKRIPQGNEPKAQFIHENNYYKRESLMFQLIEEMKAAHEPRPWCAEAYLHTDRLLVMADLSLAGYCTRPLLDTLDPPHALLAAAAVARFHAAFADYHTQKNLRGTRPYDFIELYGDIMGEPTFCASPWLRAAAKLSANLLDEFSTKYTKTTVDDLESKLAERYVEACDSLCVDETTLNVILHKDLWVNNILFKYEGGEPESALLIDYQCMRYGPPAFDLMTFLYLNTSRSFREKYEKEIIQYYFKTFLESVSNETKKRLDALGYDERQFCEWCERSRMFGCVEAITIYPMVLLEPVSAQSTFDDPETFSALMEQDRSEAVAQHARRSTPYRHRQLEVTEEFIERYVVTKGVNMQTQITKQLL